MTNKLFKKSPDSLAGESGSILDDLRDEFDPAELLKQKPPPTSSKKKPEEEKTLSDLGYPKGFVIPLLEMPFEFACEETGVEYKIPNKYAQILETAGVKVMQDFGPDVAFKWINLGVFLGVYGFCIYQFYRAVRKKGEEKKAQLVAEKKRREAEGEDVRQIADRDRA